MSVKILWALLFVFHTSGVCLGDDESVPVVDTPLGRVSGAWRTSLEGRKFASFEGIPYALPPVGELRFEEPQPIKPWSGTWQATQTTTCPQSWSEIMEELMKKINFPIGRPWEDCLHLNVYVPSDTIDRDKRLDVVVFIHGGGFMMGSGHQMVNTNYMMDMGFIVVTINYRLGILGFLSTEDDAIPGNNGMKDQVLALRWVKDNIASFGGNPDSITISGVSAGGASVHLHYFSPLSKGLFNRGVAHSGTALDPWVIKRKPAQSARRLGALLGCPDGSSEELKKCLKQRHVASILEKQDNFLGFDQLPFAPFAPVIEKKSKGAFLSEEPYKQLKEGAVLDVPCVISTCADEGLLTTGMYHNQLERLDKVWPDMAQYALYYNETLPVSKHEETAKKIKDFYLGPEEHFSEATFKQLTNMFTHRLFGIGAETSAKLQSQANKSPVYFYYFNYDKGENSLMKLFTGKSIGGVSHGDDCAYLYGFQFAEFSEGDLELKRACHNFLISYTNSGIPSFGVTDEWQPTKGSRLTYLNITDAENIILQTTDTLVAVDFWRSIDLLEYESYSVKDEL